MDQDIELKVRVDVGQAEQNLDNLDKKVDQVADSVEDLNNTAEQGVPSVGGLDKAFESAFNTIAKEGSKGGATLKKIFDSIKNAIPIVRNINNTAITGLRGVKAAIASTGIGLLVVALGELLAHWEQVTAAIQRWIPWVKRGKEEIDNLSQASENLITANTEQNKLLEHQARLLRAAGVEEENVIRFKIQETNAILANTQAQIKETEAKIAAIRAHSAFRRWITGENKDLEKLEEVLKNLEAENKKYQDSLQSLNWSLEEEEVKSQHQRTTAAKKGSEDRIKVVKEEAKSVVEELRKNGRDVEEIMEAIAKNLENKFSEESVNFFKALLDPKAPMKATEEIIPELEKAGFTINKYLIEGLLAGDAQTLNDELENMVSLRARVFAEGNATLAQDLEKELEILKKSYEAERIILEKRKALILKYVGQGPEYQHIVAQLEALGNNYAAKVEDATKQLEDFLKSRDLQYFQDKLQDKMNRSLFPSKDTMNDYVDARVEAERTRLEALRDMWEEGTEQYEYYNDRMNKVDEDRIQYISEYLLTYHQKYAEFLSNISSIFGSLADIREEDIKRRQKEGEISEEQADEEFKRVKKLQLAEVWINTISGAVGAFLKASATYPPPGGQILGAAAFTSVLAAGLAQHAKIKNTSLNSGTGGGVSAPSVGVTPLQVTDDIQVSPSALAQSQSPADQRVYILESDLQESDRRVEIREANTSF